MTTPGPFALRLFVPSGLPEAHAEIVGGRTGRLAPTLIPAPSLQGSSPEA